MRTCMLSIRRPAQADAPPQRRDTLGGECRIWQHGSQVRQENDSLGVQMLQLCVCVLTAYTCSQGFSSEGPCQLDILPSLFPELSHSAECSVFARRRVGLSAPTEVRG